VQVVSFCPDSPALAVLTDRWRHEVLPHVLRDTSDDARRVNFAKALKRSGAAGHLVAIAEKQERQARPTTTLTRKDVRLRRQTRIYSAKLFECDVREIRDRWAAYRAVTVRPNKSAFARSEQARLRATGLSISAITVVSVLYGDSWLGV